MSNYSKTDLGTGYNTNTAINTELGKIETAVNSKADKSGFTATGDIDMNSNQILNLPNPSTRNEPATYGQLLDGLVNVGVGNFREYPDMLAAQTDIANISIGDTVFLQERTGGNGGASFWNVVDASTVAEDEFRVVTGDASRSFELIIIDGIANAKQWGATGDGSTDDTAAVQAMIDYVGANNSTIAKAYFPAGTYNLTTQINIDQGAVAIIGEYYDRRQSGSPRSCTTFLWNGGATPMFSCNQSSCTFSGFNAENRGTATCWLELNVGSINQIFEKLYFILATGATAFSDAVITSNGARLGYSQFRNIIATSPAPRLVWIHDSSTTGLTPFKFSDRCLFRGATNAFTIVDIDNSTCEGVTFTDTTIIATSAEITLVDTTNNPTSQPLYTLCIEDCEFDADTGTVQATDRFLKLENTTNIRIDGCQMNLGGGGNDFATLTNCSVSSVRGNYLKSFNYLLECDDNTIVRGIGHNDTQWSNVEGICDNANCTKTVLTEGTVVTMDGATWGPEEMAVYEVEISTTSPSPYTFALDTSKPQNWEMGQKFILTIKNTSGGTIDAPLFSSGTFNVQSSAFTAPISTRQKSIIFSYNGSEADQITTEGPDVPTSP